jgi:hypothetical protein
MSDTKARPGSRHPLSWAVVTILIVVPFVAMLWVPSYSRSAPKLGGFPFFYWYQLVWVIGVAVLSVLAYLIMPKRRRRGPDKPAGDGYGQPPSGGWYGQPPGSPPGSAGGTQSGPGSTSGTEATS